MCLKKKLMKPIVKKMYNKPWGIVLLCLVLFSSCASEDVTFAVPGVTLSVKDSVDIKNGTVPEGDVVSVEKDLTRILKVVITNSVQTINNPIDLVFDDPGIATIESVETDPVTREITVTIKGKTPGETTLRAIKKNSFGITDQIQVKVTQDHYVVTIQGTNFEILPEREDNVISLSAYEYHIDWDNDGIFDIFDLPSRPAQLLEFDTEGPHTIRISGTYPNPGFRGDDTGNLFTHNISIDQWGTQQWQGMFKSFGNHTNLQVKATDNPNVSGVRDMSFMFSGATEADLYVRDWDVSNVIDMTEMFSGATSATPDVSQWKTENVQFIGSMFEGATEADPDLSTWDITNLQNAFRLFHCSGISVNNYEQALINFSNQVDAAQDNPAQLNKLKNINLGDVPVQAESPEAIEARNNLVNTHGWIINEGVTSCDGGGLPAPRISR